MTEAEDRLMRYFDGELDAAEAAEVERMLAESPHERALLADFDEVGRVVRSLAAEQGARADGIADQVMARLDAPTAARGGGAPRDALRRGRVIPFASAAALALAAAAGVVLLMRSRPPLSAPTRASDSAAVEALSVSTGSFLESVDSEQELAAAERDPGASIESVDFGAQNGSIFMVGSGPQVTPVVWLVDDGEQSDDRMKPL